MSRLPNTNSPKGARDGPPEAPRTREESLRQYFLLRKKLPWYCRLYLACTDALNLDPNTLELVRVRPKQTDRTHRTVEGVRVRRTRVKVAKANLPKPPCRHSRHHHCPMGLRCSQVVAWFDAWASSAGLSSPAELPNWCRVQEARIGATLSAGFFSDSPQRFAINNRHLPDYFAGRVRAQETTPYEIPPSQLHLLPKLGMENPQPDAPRVPHGLHKSIEEGQLRRLRRVLAPHTYGLVSIKDEKLRLLPPSATIQNPVHQAKDVTRYPGTAIKSSRFTHAYKHPVYLMHDVASEVTPHELVERLIKVEVDENGVEDSNPEAQLFVTGINPIEVIDKAKSFEPSSHKIEYDLGGFNYIFTDSEEEAYFTSQEVTRTWLRTSSVCASNGRVYHVTLLEYKLGHCVWHIYCGQGSDQHTRTFSTGSYVQLPPAVTGTLSGEYLPATLLTSILSFVDYTTDLSPRNLAAKVVQIANASNPKTTSRERWIARHIAQQRYYKKDFWWYVNKLFWQALYLVTVQWQMLKPLPDIYDFVDESKRVRTLHPTPGGGWSFSHEWTYERESIPNNPTMLQRLSAFSASAFVFLLPKILVGEILSYWIWQIPLWKWLRNLWQWADLSPERLILTASIVAITSILPGHVVKVFGRLSGHFWRQLWWPGWVSSMFEMLVVEFTGGPGYKFLVTLPGRGWFWQFYLWAVAVAAVLPNLLDYLFAGWWNPWFLPWFAFTQGHVVALVASVWFLCIVLENLLSVVKPNPLPALSPARPVYLWTLRTATWPFIKSWLFKPAPNYSLPIDVILWFLRDRFVSLPWFLTKACLASLHRLLHHPVRLAFISLNWFHRSVILGTVFNHGTCARIANLPPIPRKPTSVLRGRYVDIVLPTVTVQAANIPVANPLVQLAVDPAGMAFPDFLQQVQAAYAQDPNRYPAIAPQFSCFWQCIASLGGTPHMWYSWFLARMNRVPNVANPADSSVTLGDVRVFEAASLIGVGINGLVSQAANPGPGMPTVSLVMGRSLLQGYLHFELANVAQPNAELGALARVIRTAANLNAGWMPVIQAAFNASPVDATPHPTPFLLAAAGIHAMPTTRNQVMDAIVASFTANLIDPVNQEGFAFDQNTLPNPLDPLFTYGLALNDQPIAGATFSTLWQTFRGLGKRFRLKGPDHPISVPDMKIGANARERQRNANFNNRKPEVPGFVTLYNELATQLSRFKDLALPVVPLQPERITFTADLDKAKRFISDIRANPAVLGAFANNLTTQSLDAILDTLKLENKTVAVPCTLYLGVSGCGKTVQTVAHLKALPANEREEARIVNHTEDLRAEAKRKLDFEHFRGFNFPTLASIIMEPSTGPVVFDDAGCVWPGLVDLVVLTNPLMTELVINGDPAQGLAKFPVAGGQSRHDEGVIETVSRVATTYATLSHRLFKLLTDTFGIHTTNITYGHITHSVGPKVGIPTLTASPRYAEVLSKAGRDSYTYDTSQGKDFDEDVEIDATGLEGAILDRTGYVAMTRSKKGVYLRLDAANPNNPVKVPPTGSDLINALVYSMRMGGTPSLLAPNWLVKAAFYQHLANCMPSLPWFAQVGAALHPSAASLLAPICPLSDPDPLMVSEAPVQEHMLSADPPHAHVVQETHHLAKEFREVGVRGCQTDQFKETAWVNPHVHKRNDTPTYFLSVEARLKAATPGQNRHHMSKVARSELCDEYDKLVPHPPLWNPEKHARYVDLAWEEYVGKRTVSSILAKIKAHDPMRTGADLKITLKNQVIKKAEKRYKKEAIPGQLIHEYDLHQTIYDAAYAKFLEDEIIPAFPKRFLFYRRLNPAQFVKAYKDSGWRTQGESYSSDVTRWDVGCDAGLLNFDLHVFRRSQLPADFLDNYQKRRLESSCQHGPLATMQNSGDRMTWPMNTVRRAVVTSWACELTEEDTCAVNGDDAAVDRHCNTRQLPDSPWEFKDVNGETVEFSGFELGQETPTYSSEGLLYRTLILIERSKTVMHTVMDKWVNYLDLLSICDLQHPAACAVADFAHQYMTPELFARYLPAPLRAHYPTVLFG